MSIWETIKSAFKPSSPKPKVHLIRGMQSETVCGIRYQNFQSFPDRTYSRKKVTCEACKNDPYRTYLA